LFQFLEDMVAQQLVRAGSIHAKTSMAATVAAVVLALVSLPASYAQKSEKPARRVVEHVTPEYPVSLRAAHVGGLVRLSVTVSSSGNVTKIDLIGGNAIFSESAIKAVTKWKYAPSAAETTAEVQIRFNPDSPSVP